MSEVAALYHLPTADISKMSHYGLIIKDMIIDKETERGVRANISMVLGKYLKDNPKGKMISTISQMDLLVDFIVNHCSKLEIQELDFIMKHGVLGRFGILYNEISIDTICGVGGWIETYFNEFRQLRPPKPEPRPYDKTGNEKSNKEYLNTLTGDMKRLYELREKSDSKNNTLTIDDVKDFYRIKGYTLDEFKEHQEIHAWNYVILYKGMTDVVSKSEYIAEENRKFVRNNIFKNKE